MLQVVWCMLPEQLVTPYGPIGGRRSPMTDEKYVMEYVPEYDAIKVFARSWQAGSSPVHVAREMVGAWQFAPVRKAKKGE